MPGTFGFDLLSIWLFLLVWDIFWKGIGLWHAARNKQKTWFIALLIVNTVGILPIVYLKFFRKRSSP